MLDKNISNFCISFTILDSSSRRKLVRYEIIFPLKNLDAYLFHNLNELKIDTQPQKCLVSKKTQRTISTIFRCLCSDTLKIEYQCKKCTKWKLLAPGIRKLHFFVDITENDYIFDSLKLEDCFVRKKCYFRVNFSFFIVLL